MRDPEPRRDAITSSDVSGLAPDIVIERIETSEKALGEGMTIRRALPARQRRMVGAWCFLDHFGPIQLKKGPGMRVGPHPHCGLQTVTWLIEGEVLHRDSLEFSQRIRPGQLNLMTAGRGIAHSEESPIDRPATLHGVQLWIALPAAEQYRQPSFEHYPELPCIAQDSWTVTVLAGDAFGLRSPASIYSPLVGLDIRSTANAATDLPLDPAFEYGVIALSGSARIDAESLAVGTFLYLGRGRRAIALATAAPARIVLLGGVPFGEEIIMWWNFVGRDRAELTRACNEWNAGQGPFGEVLGYDGARLQAPLPPWSA